MIRRQLCGESVGVGHGQVGKSLRDQLKPLKVRVAGQSLACKVKQDGASTEMEMGAADRSSIGIIKRQRALVTREADDQSGEFLAAPNLENDARIEFTTAHELQALLFAQQGIRQAPGRVCVQCFSGLKQVVAFRGFRAGKLRGLPARLGNPKNFQFVGMLEKVDPFSPEEADDFLQGMRAEAEGELANRVDRFTAEDAKGWP